MKRTDICRLSFRLGSLKIFITSSSTQESDDGDKNITGERKSPDSLYHRRQFSLRRPPSAVGGDPCDGWLGGRLLPLLSLLVLLVLLLLLLRRPGQRGADRLRPECQPTSLLDDRLVDW